MCVRGANIVETRVGGLMAVGGQNTGSYIAGCNTHQHKGATHAENRNIAVPGHRLPRCKVGEPQGTSPSICHRHLSGADRCLRASTNKRAQQRNKARFTGEWGTRSHRQGASKGLPAARRLLASCSSRHALRSQRSSRSGRVDSLSLSGLKNITSSDATTQRSPSQSSRRPARESGKATRQYSHSKSNVTRSDICHPRRYSFSSCLRTTGVGCSSICTCLLTWLLKQIANLDSAANRFRHGFGVLRLASPLRARQVPLPHPLEHSLVRHRLFDAFIDGPGKGNWAPG